MCRVFGCVSAEPVSIRHELLDAENPLIRQSEDHDSGWGMAVYDRAEGGRPACVRFPEAAYRDDEFKRATALRGRIFNVHVRRATMGGLTSENTHPFCLDAYSFSHNGTVIDYPRLMHDGLQRPRGQTDSEVFFNLLMHDFDRGDAIRSLRRSLRTVVARSAFSGLNFLLSDGERLYAYRLGMFELHWLNRDGQLVVSSEKVTGESWHTVAQDVLLVLDPDDLEEPHAERLIGDQAMSRARIRKLEGGEDLRGEARGALAAKRAARTAAAAHG